MVSYKIDLYYKDSADNFLKSTLFFLQTTKYVLIITRGQSQ